MYDALDPRRGLLLECVHTTAQGQFCCVGLCLQSLKWGCGLTYRVLVLIRPGPLRWQCQELELVCWFCFSINHKSNWISVKSASCTIVLHWVSVGCHALQAAPTTAYHYRTTRQAQGLQQVTTSWMLGRITTDWTCARIDASWKHEHVAASFVKHSKQCIKTAVWSLRQAIHCADSSPVAPPKSATARQKVGLGLLLT